MTRLVLVLCLLLVPLVVAAPSGAAGGVNLVETPCLAVAAEETDKSDPLATEVAIAEFATVDGTVDVREQNGWALVVDADPVTCAPQPVAQPTRAALASGSAGAQCLATATGAPEASAPLLAHQVEYSTIALGATVHTPDGQGIWLGVAVRPVACLPEPVRKVIDDLPPLFSGRVNESDEGPPIFP